MYQYDTNKSQLKEHHEQLQGARIQIDLTPYARIEEKVIMHDAKQHNNIETPAEINIELNKSLQARVGIVIEEYWTRINSSES